MAAKIPKFIKIKNTRVSLISIEGYERNEEIIEFFLGSGIATAVCDNENDAIRLTEKLDREMSKIGVKFIEVD
ncbi:MAG: hypothetical protein ACOC4Y_01875 [bacterium]